MGKSSVKCLQVQCTKEPENKEAADEPLPPKMRRAFSNYEEQGGEPVVEGTFSTESTGRSFCELLQAHRDQLDKDFLLTKRSLDIKEEELEARIEGSKTKSRVEEVSALVKAPSRRKWRLERSFTTWNVNWKVVRCLLPRSPGCRSDMQLSQKPTITLCDR